MAEAAHELGADADFFLPPLAVNLGDPTTRSVNRFGAEQTGCRHCGKCSVGCNHGAKNSLDMNYLPLAQSHGAEIRARCEVTGLAEGYEVTYCDHETGDEHVVQAGSLVLAAGALGTTELLLRHGQALAPDGGLSPRLGEHYSGNGDLVTVALGIQEEWKPTVGPAITAGIVANDRHWFLIEDGGIPPWAVSDVGVRADERDPEEPPLQVIPIVDHAAILLGMGRDTATGRIEAEPDGGGVDIDWPYDDNQSYYDDVKGYHEHLGLALARLAHLDAGPLERVPVSVHSLGGAVMAEDPENGVVDPHGEVFGVPGLFVFDGAAIPTATGVNPSHTIAAVAERNAERLARKLCGDPSWQAPERATAPRHTDPLPTS